MKTLILIMTLLLLQFSYADSQVLITEFLADPKDSIETEWVELYNVSDQIVELNDWQLCDLVGCGNFRSYQFQPETYIVVCQDTLAFENAYPDYSGDMFEISGWRQLNNNGDMILLTNSDSQTIDSIKYDSGSDNNISWERIHLDQAGWDPDNWHRSLDTSGSTPGKINSIAGGFPLNFTISLPDKLFSPGCDCPYAYLNCDISIPRDCQLSLTVYSLEGEKLKVIYNQESLVTGEYLYDGTDSEGHYLDVGMYILLAEIAGAVSSFEKLVFGVAKQ
jgi:Lamin Tail Domain